MNISAQERRLVQLIKDQAAKRNISSSEFFEAMIESTRESFNKYPEDKQAAYDYGIALLDARYPVSGIEGN